MCPDVGAFKRLERPAGAGQATNPIIRLFRGVYKFAPHPKVAGEPRVVRFLFARPKIFAPDSGDRFALIAHLVQEENETVFFFSGWKVFVKLCCSSMIFGEFGEANA